MRDTPPRMLWHGWEKPSGGAAEMLWRRFCLRYRTLGCAHAWLEHLAAGTALIRLSVPLQRWAGYLPRAVPLGAALMALWLYMDIRHDRKGFRVWVHRALMAAVVFFALAWTLRAGILTGQITL